MGPHGGELIRTRRALTTAPLRRAAMRSHLLDRQASARRWPLAAAPYMGVLFVVLTAACVVLALAALVRDTVAVYALAALTCTLAILGYIATRLVAFPMLADDVGNWFEPLGVVSVGSEAVVVLSAAAALRAALRGGGQVPDRRSLEPSHP